MIILNSLGFYDDKKVILMIHFEENIFILIKSMAMLIFLSVHTALIIQWIFIDFSSSSTVSAK